MIGLQQGFPTGGLWAKSGLLTILSLPFVNFEIHKNTRGNGIHLALDMYLWSGFGPLWPTIEISWERLAYTQKNVLCDMNDHLKKQRDVGNADTTVSLC